MTDRYGKFASSKVKISFQFTMWTLTSTMRKIIRVNLKRFLGRSYILSRVLKFPCYRVLMTFSLFILILRQLSKQMVTILSILFKIVAPKMHDAQFSL